MMSALNLVLFAVLCTQSVYCNLYQGPTALPVVLHNGFLEDTHEVAAAKNAHLAAQGTQHSQGADNGYEGSHDEEINSYHGDISYHGPTAVPHVLHDGHIADTHEVAAAKAEHFAAVAKAKSHGGNGDHYSGTYDSDLHVDSENSQHKTPYHGPPTKPVVLKSGYLADTHEVAAAKNAHLAAQEKQHIQGADNGYEESNDEEHSSSHGDIGYHGSTAIPNVLHDGHIADTHEVAAAKAEHFAAVPKAKSHEGNGDYYTNRDFSDSGADQENSQDTSSYHSTPATPWYSSFNIWDSLKRIF